jgi:hypothetical protein
MRCFPSPIGGLPPATNSGPEKTCPVRGKNKHRRSAPGRNGARTARTMQSARRIKSPNTMYRQGAKNAKCILRAVRFDAFFRAAHAAQRSKRPRRNRLLRCAACAARKNASNLTARSITITSPALPKPEPRGPAGAAQRRPPARSRPAPPGKGRPGAPAFPEPAPPQRRAERQRFPPLP